ncbi:MAG: tRNA (N6-isopentenyl adenosine(37)-C2)-methylthiotransferase MiaB [Lachnospiraceae bacterium]|nr:tRNA (N6-isopentenyl adenosine(37)-C2)-methylthiotransferase MiaB [Lachnospiraceae bacterium]
MATLEAIEEAKKQREYIQKIKEIITAQDAKRKKPLTACVVTFGCQMNARDSEKIVGVLTEAGYEIIEDEEQADFIIFNTCSIRENANTRLYGHLGNLKKFKRKNPDMRIGLCGCMMQEPHVVEKIKKSYPHVDLIFGTHNLYQFAQVLYESLLSDELVIELMDKNPLIVEDLPSVRKFPFKSGVNITFGCNNFCTFCIVPHVRGREHSREPRDIVNEIRALVKDGVKEVMLLGQNVNSYGNDFKDGFSFADLLREVDQIEGLERIRYMSPHPKDFTREVLEVMRDSKKICHQIHMPLQSGSTSLLKRMNRVYSKEQYLEVVRMIREILPDVSLTTDIIVGFPGETEEDFEDTCDVVREARYDAAYTFIYSPRVGTPAAKFPDQVPADVSKRRFDYLLHLIQTISAKESLRFVGTTQKVLVESVSEQDETLLTGRLDSNLLVHFKGDRSLIGSMVNVTLKESKGFYYFGEIEA